MSDVDLYDDKVWHVQRWSERKGRWVRVAITLANPSGLWVYEKALQKRNRLRLRYPKRRYRVRIGVRNPFTLLEGEHEIVRTSREPATPGSHAPGSYHYQIAPWGGSSARDYGVVTNGVTKVRRVATAIRAGTRIGGTVPRYRGKLVAELYGPFKWYVRDGVVHSGQFPKHEDHVHLALTP